MVEARLQAHLQHDAGQHPAHVQDGGGVLGGHLGGDGVPGVDQTRHHGPAELRVRLAVPSQGQQGGDHVLVVRWGAPIAHHDDLAGIGQSHEVERTGLVQLARTHDHPGVADGVVGDLLLRAHLAAGGQDRHDGVALVFVGCRQFGEQPMPQPRPTDDHRVSLRDDPPALVPVLHGPAGQFLDHRAEDRPAEQDCQQSQQQGGELLRPGSLALAEFEDCDELLPIQPGQLARRALPGHQLGQAPQQGSDDQQDQGRADEHEQQQAHQALAHQLVEVVLGILASRGARGWGSHLTSS